MIRRSLFLFLFLGLVQAEDKRIFLIGNSLSWDTVPSKLDGDVQWHVDCGKSLPFILANPEQPCVKSSGHWPKALKEHTYDVLVVQPHYGSNLQHDKESILTWWDMQPQATLVIHTGWALAKKQAIEYGESIGDGAMAHSPAYFEALSSHLRGERPNRVLRITRAQDALDLIRRDIEGGFSPLKDLSDLYRDQIHMTLTGGRYLMHNVMRKALGHSPSRTGFDTTPVEVGDYLDTVITRVDADSRLVSTRPNMVFFIADDISWNDIGCYGNPKIKTPRIDALAAKGVRFNQAYLTTSSCSPSRCSIITGRYPHNTGAPELHTKLPDSQIRFPELLRKAGYYTVLSGKNHMFGNKDRAFDRITGGGGPGKEKDWVDHIKNRPNGQPFFMWFASSDAHRGWKTSDDAPLYGPEDVVVPPYLIDGEGTRKDLALYYHEVSRFDTYVGRVADALEEDGLLDNTMIVVAADNGRPFPRAKSRLYDSGIKTPWVVHFPAVIKTPAVTESLVSVIDLSATCLDLAGIAIPEPIQGVSFLPILRDSAATTRDMVFAEHNWHVYANHERMVRFGDYLYIRNNLPNQMNLCYEAHNDPAGIELWEAQAAGKTKPHQQQIFANPCPPEELFAVSEDPFQFTNLVDVPEHAKPLEAARQLLSRWTEQTGDTVPEHYTPHRHAPPRIEDGNIIPADKKSKSPRNPHREMPGASRKAMTINHPGPVLFE